MPILNAVQAADVADSLSYNGDGLIPAIAQSNDDGAVLMMAWMNRDAVVETLTTGRVTYYSRSRAKLWRKGETSGHTQSLVSFRVDCDADTLLLLIDQVGPACHTNRQTCFYREAQSEGLASFLAPQTSN